MKKLRYEALKANKAFCNLDLCLVGILAISFETSLFFSLSVLIIEKPLDLNTVTLKDYREEKPYLEKSGFLVKHFDFSTLLMKLKGLASMASTDHHIARGSHENNVLVADPTKRDRHAKNDQNARNSNLLGRRYICGIDKGGTTKYILIEDAYKTKDSRVQLVEFGPRHSINLFIQKVKLILDPS